MISVITCSKDPTRLAAAEASLRSALDGEEWEMVRIPDARSLAEGYNRGIAQARGDILVFSHDDVEIMAPGLGGRLRSHLSRFDVLGAAGANRVISGAWLAAGPPYIYGQIVHLIGIGPFNVDVYGAPRRVVGGIQALDGLFMAATRSACERIQFDEQTFDGFHLYDMDFSYAAFRAGLKLCVACDIPLLHYSPGRFDDNWRTYADRFQQKWNITPPEKMPKFQWSAAKVNTREEALDLMRPSFWGLD